MKTSFKFSAFFFFSIFLIFQIFSFQIRIVNSQGSTDSCSSSLKLKGELLFDTTSFYCLSVWDQQGYILRYMRTDTNVWSYVLSAPNTNAYIAMGFSKNGKMVGSTAVVGWVSNEGTATMKKYFLGGQSPNEVLPDEGNLQLVNFTSSVVAEDSRIYMAFQLNTEMPSNRLIYSVGQTGMLPSAADFRLTEHQDRISTSLNYNSGQSEKSTPYANLRRSHGLLNMFGWAIFMPIGVMVARYLRQYDPIWFYSHTTIQSLGFILGFVGVISGLVLNNRLQNNVNRHKGIGIFILVLGCLQVIALLARPEKSSKVRKYWNWYHYTTGRVLIMLATVNVFYGIHLGDAGSSWKAGFAVVLVILFITAAIFEIRMWKRK
ncbi:cytochrome b561 and DOMON domain-containing protein At3g07570-like [Nicotiana tomentosiformis]|uniref:cytochrome b561 and DOMON domain-containing protein At3g07570-like n=1 Tax=Nicotiana tomentosiformis TaxID=4098 RepID=UPI00051B69BE|nr:cytochrome b561 and DOMON domain-containing protein At3g07570-like [Nicotiana tomentosiformis]